MREPDLDKTISRWVRLGVLFGSTPCRSTPDLEQLLLDTAQLLPRSPRLFYMTLTWLSRYGNFVARHRLKHLIEVGLQPGDQPALAVLVALAMKHGASRELLIAAEVCQRADSPKPLFDAHRGHSALRRIARSHASPEGLAWNLWVADQAPKLDALRPARWLLARNPGYLDRIVRKGDLRCSILLALQHDAAEHAVESEVALARLCSASRLAIRSALGDLEREGRLLRTQVPGRRGTKIALAPPLGATA